MGPSLSNSLNNSPVLGCSPILITICGATATGKSGLAINLAQRLNSPILSADSRQVYRELDIGTAKPSEADRQLAPHSLIDICDPTQTLTLAEFQEQARTLIEGFHSGTFPTIPLLVGGTGLYIKSIVQGLKIPRVGPQADLRAQLQALGQPQCYGFLRQVDADSATRIHANDGVRTLRALEVYYVTGRPISAQQGENPPPYRILQIGLDSDQIEQRIAQRTGQMLDLGLVAETQALIEKYGPDLPLLQTLGYQEIGQHICGAISLAEAERLTILHTRQFAKRQRTWFRADPRIEWFDGDGADLADRVWARIQEFGASGL
jgi:tRNA dimethylallyltransferase